MYRSIAIFICFLIGITIISGQKIHKVSFEYKYNAPETMSLLEAKRTALERAKIEAIAEKFGTVVSQNNMTSINNTNGDSNVHFYSHGGSDVRGEWIETLGEPQFSIQYDNGMVVVDVIVEGVIREIKANKIEVTTNTLRNGIENRFSSTEFNAGDDMYLYFKSPVDGYLSVFLMDDATDAVYCLLPYSNSNGEPVEVKRDKSLILFSEAANTLKNQTVDEYTLTLSGENPEYNVIYVLFSPDRFTKVTLDNDENNATLPRNTTVKSFHRWLANARKHLKNLCVTEIPISIHPNE